MFTNRDGCTVYEPTIGADRMESYVRHIIPAVYWENKQGQFTTDKAMKQNDSVLCVIPASSLSEYIPKVNDLLVCGICNSTEPPETGTRTILSVNDFRYGSLDVQHLEVTAV